MYPISLLNRSALIILILATPYQAQAALPDHQTKLLTAAAATVTAAAAQQFLQTDYGSVQTNNRDYYWDWDQINTQNINFPQSFLWGVGTSAYQVEGNCTNTDWHQWEQTPGNVEHPCGKACDHWNRYKEDIALLKELGVGIYRFSLAWDKIIPEYGKFDQRAIDHYQEVCRELKRQGIKSLIGFHHYTDPQWFADLGGFEKEENIEHFVRYCQLVMSRFRGSDIEVDYWSVFNSPAGYAFHKYLIGDFPPGIKNDKQRTLTVLKNMMEAHVQVYQAGKRINPKSKIGFLHNVLFLEPWRPWHPLDCFAASIATHMTDTCIFNFFTTGTFKAKIPFDAAPFMANVEHTNKSAPHSVDFIGINYYGHGYLKNTQRLLHPNEIQTDNPTYTVYPEGLYRAIKLVTEVMRRPMEQATKRTIPILVTENGIAHEDPKIRKLFFERYLYALNKAIEDGYPVDAYIFWSFMDNYEWGSFKKKYGLVAVNFDDPKLPRSIKTDEGTQYLISLMKKTTHE